MVSTGVWIPVSDSEPSGLRSAVSNCFRVPSSGATDYVFRGPVSLQSTFPAQEISCLDDVLAWGKKLRVGSGWWLSTVSRWCERRYVVLKKAENCCDQIAGALRRAKSFSVRYPLKNQNRKEIGSARCIRANRSTRRALNAQNAYTQAAFDFR